MSFLSYLQTKYKTTKIVVSNQSGVARGYFDEQRVRQINEEIGDRLKTQGVSIDAWQFCTDVDAAHARRHPEIAWKRQYVKTTTRRKPSVAMVTDALALLGKKTGDFDAMIVLGNSDDDAGLAHVLGARWIDVRGTSYEELLKQW